MTGIAQGFGAGTYAKTGEKFLGVPVGGTLITHATPFTQPFPAGTRDFCGTPMP